MNVYTITYCMQDELTKIASINNHKGFLHRLVTGHSGSGKSTLARKMSAKTGAPIISLDDMPSIRAILDRQKALAKTSGGRLDLSPKTVAKNRAIELEAIQSALGSKTPSIIEGSYLLDHDPSMFKGHAMALVNRDRNKILDQRVERQRMKDISRGISWSKERAEGVRSRGEQLLDHYQDGVDTWEASPLVKNIGNFNKTGASTEKRRDGIATGAGVGFGYGANVAGRRAWHKLRPKLPQAKKEQILKLQKVMGNTPVFVSGKVSMGGSSVMPFTQRMKTKYAKNPKYRDRVDKTFGKDVAKTLVGTNKGAVLISNKNSSLATVAHELGHATKNKNSLAKLLQVVGRPSYKAAPVVSSLAAGLTDKDSKINESAPVIGGLLAAPTLVEETRANILGRRGLRKVLGKNSSNLKKNVKSLLATQAFYTIPAIGAVVAPLIVNELRKTAGSRIRKDVISYLRGKGNSPASLRSKNTKGLLELLPEKHPLRKQLTKDQRARDQSNSALDLGNSPSGDDTLSKLEHAMLKTKGKRVWSGSHKARADEDFIPSSFSQEFAIHSKPPQEGVLWRGNPVDTSKKTFSGLSNFFTKHPDIAAGYSTRGGDYSGASKKVFKYKVSPEKEGKNFVTSAMIFPPKYSKKDEPPRKLFMKRLREKADRGKSVQGVKSSIDAKKIVSPEMHKKFGKLPTYETVGVMDRTGIKALGKGEEFTVRRSRGAKGEMGYALKKVQEKTASVQKTAGFRDDNWRPSRKQRLRLKNGGRITQGNKEHQRIVRSNDAASYKEGGSFTHDGREYSLDAALALADKKKVRKMSVKRLSWVLNYDKPNKKRMSRADISAPLLVAADKRGRPTVIDGLHRLAKANATGVSRLPVRYLSKSDMNKL